MFLAYVAGAANHFREAQSATDTEFKQENKYHLVKWNVTDITYNNIISIFVGVYYKTMEEHYFVTI